MIKNPKVLLAVCCSGALAVACLDRPTGYDTRCVDAIQIPPFTTG